MRPLFRKLRIKQLERALQPFYLRLRTRRVRAGVGSVPSESDRDHRTTDGNSSREGPTLVVNLQKSEAEYRITLGSLRAAADALGCQLVYALVPKSGSIQDLAERRARAKAAENVRAVDEHSMALEDQAVGGIDNKIEEETRRILKRDEKK